ncbi:lipase family protein [Olivibacter sp. XZL3]|uniref:lipase family protein n=1 Tax=Olivibacter sp. XZL3 TaxID=1735116 RepID=UPI001066C3A3|nr:lipase family protein [Olivibacter sp. XZL3]
MYRYIVGIFLFLHINTEVVSAQSLKPGFDKQEYETLLRISAQVDTLKPGPNYLEPPIDYERVYRSNVVGLRNRWDLWLSRDKQRMVVSLRGTIGEAVSWLENFYCASLPAKGVLNLSDSSTFTYTFSKDPKATVHAGWTIGIAHLAPDIVRQIKEHYKAGTKQLLVMGHSQGGALAFLLTSYLKYQIEEEALPADLLIKTYCSAAPKPGNLFYAYDYDYLTRGGWGLTVVNAADWVPETPFSLQTMKDFNHLNPFGNIEPLLKKQKPFYVRWYLKHAFGKLDKSTKKSRKNFEKYLGTTLFKEVHKTLPELKEPIYASSMNYMRAGVPIVLQPDSAYYKVYPDTGKNVFIHHALKAYANLLERY